MSGFKNLYELLRISPLATPEQIRVALSNAAQSSKISLEDAQMVEKLLLNEETRKKYNAKLFAEYPEILQQIVDEKVAGKESKSEKNQQQTIKSIENKKEVVIQKSNTQQERLNKNAKNITLLIAFVILGVVLATCSLLKTEDKPAQTIEASTPDPSTPDYSAYKAAADEIRVNKENVPILFDEPNTTYTIIWHKVNPDGLIEIMVERTGSSGTSYSKKEIDCASHSDRYLGTGDSIEEALMPRPDDKLTYSDAGSAGASIDAACEKYNVNNNNNNTEQPSDNTNQDENADKSINLEE